MTQNIETTITVPPLPEPLSIYRPNSPEVVRQHRAAEAAHHAAKHAIEQAAERAKQREHAHANRILSEQEYFDLAVQRFNERTEQERERAAAAAIKASQREAALATEEEIINVTATDPHTFLTDVQHFFERGYRLDFSNFWTVGPTYNAVGMTKVSAAKPKKGATS